jgi:hypothetical protein
MYDTCHIGARHAILKTTNERLPMLKAYKPPKGRKRPPLTVTIPTELVERLVAQTRYEERTRSQIVEAALLHYLAEKERKAA